VTGTPVHRDTTWAMLSAVTVSLIEEVSFASIAASFFSSSGIVL
jgi:hypothetical protein